MSLNVFFILIIKLPFVCFFLNKLFNKSGCNTEQWWWQASSTWGNWPGLSHLLLSITFIFKCHQSTWLTCYILYPPPPPQDSGQQVSLCWVSPNLGGSWEVSVAAPKLWNQLPQQADSLPVFKSLLKTDFEKKLFVNSVSYFNPSSVCSAFLKRARVAWLPWSLVWHFEHFYFCQFKEVMISSLFVGLWVC